MQRSSELKNTPVVILCGGKGIIIDGACSERTNKALINIGDLPMFWRVIQTYVLHGASKFILATGYQGNKFGETLEQIGALQADGSPNCYHVLLGQQNCYVTLVNCGPDASTASRLLACKAALDATGDYDHFAVAYSDTLSDVDLGSEMQFHKKSGLICTLVAAKMPVRFRVLGIRPGEVLVRGFAARPVIEACTINGGYYLFSQNFWNVAHLLTHSIALENEPLEHLAAAGQLVAYEHRGAWQTCDAERDLPELDRIARQISDSGLQ